MGIDACAVHLALAADSAQDSTRRAAALFTFVTKILAMLTKMKNFAEARPRLASWIFLAVGMVVILIISAPKDGTLTVGNWIFLILATIGLAGLCAWIIGWENGDEDADEAKAAK